MFVNISIKNKRSLLFNATWNEGTANARLVLIGQTLMMTVEKGGQKFSTCDAASHVLTAYKGAPYEKNFRIEFLQYWKACSCAILLLYGSVVHHCLLL